MRKEDSVEKQEYEARLRRRLKILKEQLEAGKISFAEGLDTEKSLLSVRMGPDGEIDLDTVDGTVRSMALAITAMHDREEIKKEASLSEIQNMYFEFIEGNFGKFYDIMLERKLTPHDAAMALSRTEKSIHSVISKLDEFMDIIKQFWDGVGDIAHYHVEDMHGNIKGIFGGDLFPSHDESIASKCGIYTDTVVLPDPFPSIEAHL